GDTPIEVKTRPKGDFIIQGLKPGKHYKLIARTNQGDRKMAGTVIVEASKPNVVIKMRDDLFSSTTPPIPSPAPPRSKTEDTKPADASQKKAALQGQERPASAVVPVWEPGSVTVPRPDAGKVPLGIREPPATQSAPVDRSRIAEGKGRRPLIPGTAQVPGSMPPVPSCVLTGKQL